MIAVANAPSGRSGIRVGTPDDADAISGVINAAFVVERVAFDGDRVDAEGVRGLMGKGTFLVAEKDHSPEFTGCVYIEVRGERGYLGLLSVEPSLQGRGLGKTLTAAAEAHCRAAGCSAVDLRVISPRAEALLPFYQRVGYTQTGTAPFPSDVKTKVPCHYILMTKSLV
jgi:GNAT superfamily N-acetyltransferase